MLKGNALTAYFSPFAVVLSTAVFSYPDLRLKTNPQSEITPGTPDVGITQGQATRIYFRYSQ